MGTVHSSFRFFPLLKELFGIDDSQIRGIQECNVILLADWLHFRSQVIPYTAAFFALTGDFILILTSFLLLNLFYFFLRDPDLYSRIIRGRSIH
jgi:hypothetical protein